MSRAGVDTAFASPPHYLGCDTEPVGSAGTRHADHLTLCS